MSRSTNIAIVYCENRFEITLGSGRLGEVLGCRIDGESLCLEGAEALTFIERHCAPLNPSFFDAFQTRVILDMARQYLEHVAENEADLEEDPEQQVFVLPFRIWVRLIS